MVLAESCGKIAQLFGFILPLEVLISNAGCYIGTVFHGLPFSRESVEYFTSNDAAHVALLSGTWTQRQFL